jgi:hypothetical protein
VLGRLAPTKAVSAHSASLHFQAVRPSRHNLRGIFADIDAIARLKVRLRAMLLCGECLRNNVTDISCVDASPQKRLARLLGAGKGRVGACAVQADVFYITRELVSYTYRVSRSHPAKPYTLKRLRSRQPKF